MKLAIAFLFAAACGDDLTYPPIVTLEPDAAPELDACTYVTDAEPANACCELDSDPVAAGECLRAQLAPNTCAKVACYHGCDRTFIDVCNR